MADATEALSEMAQTISTFASSSWKFELGDLNLAMATWRSQLGDSKFGNTVNIPPWHQKLENGCLAKITIVRVALSHFGATKVVRLVCRGFGVPLK